MNRIKLTAKGQFTLNKQLLDHIGAKFGDYVIIKKQSDGTLNIRPTHNIVPLQVLQGCIETNLSYSDTEIQQAITQGYIKSGIGLEHE